MNCVLNIDKDEKLNNFIVNNFSVIKSNGEIPEHLDLDLAMYHRRKEESQRRTATMFGDYRYSRMVLNEFSRQIGISHPDIFKKRFDLNYSTVTSNRSRRRSKGSKQKDLLLCRCEFCYRFRTMERKRGVDPSWHCDRVKCKKQYNAWEQDLRRKGISLKGQMKSENLESLY